MDGMEYGYRPTVPQRRAFFNPADSMMIYGLAIAALVAWSIVMSFATLVGMEIVSSFAFTIFAAAVNQALFIGVFFLFCGVRKIKPDSAIELRSVSVVNALIIALIGVIAIFGFMNLSITADYFFTLIGYRVSDAGLSFNTPVRFVVGIVFIGILPAIGEELIFRGAIMHGFSGLGKWAAVLMSAAMFSLCHMNPSQTVHQFIIGIVLGLVVWEARSIWAGVIIHAINNCIAVILDFTNFFDLYSSMEVTTLVLSAVVAALFAAAAIYALVKLIKSNNANTTFPLYSPVQKEGAVRLLKSTNSLIYGIIGIAIAALLWIITLIMGIAGML